MARRFIAALLTAGAVATFAVSTLRADQPDGVMCTFEVKGKKIEVPYGAGKFGNIADAVKRCIADGGHPSGVYRGKGGK